MKSLGREATVSATSDTPSDQVQRDEIERELQRVLASPSFSSAPLLKRLLAYVISETLQGRADSIKETSIASSVHRDPDYDPKTSARVRTDMGRVRDRLKSYYDTEEGRTSRVKIQMSPGTYVPVFTVAVREPIASAQPARRPRFLFASAAVLAIVVVSSGIYLKGKPTPMTPEEIVRSYSIVEQEINKKQFQTAIDLLGRMIQAEPRNSQLYYLRGVAYRYWGESAHRPNLFESAIGQFNQALTLNSKHALSYYERAVAYSRLEKYRDAVNDLDRAIPLAAGEPKLPYIFNELGMAHMKLGDKNRDQAEWNLAVKNFSASIQHDPKSGSTFHNRGAAYARLKENAKALADYTNALRLLPPDDRDGLYWTYRDRANLRLEMGDRTGAESDRREAEKFSPAGTH